MNDHDLRSGHCPSCGHNEIIEASPVTLPSNAGSVSHGVGLPLALTHQTSQFLGMRMDETRSPLGVLWTYTCRQCGLTQWVAAKPAEVPIGPDHGTRLITGAPPQPFR